MYMLLSCPQLTTTVHVDVQLRVSECSTCELCVVKKTCEL
jgi:hypothetical protein